MTTKNGSNRRRKWAPKARTGCRTCKQRHVKCDEAKPTCERCHLSGFRCDGYPLSTDKDDTSGSPPEEDSSVSDSRSPGSQTSLSVATTKSETPATSIDSPLAASPLVISPSEPYINNERYFCKYFLDLTSTMVGRSKTGPHFWQVLVPQAAWSYPSVRHAMLAAAMSCESLLNPSNSVIPRRQSQSQVVAHTSKAIQSLLSGSVPLDVVLLTSATLGILGLFNGQWDTACMHVSSGARLAKDAQNRHSSDSYISFYCEAFASALPAILTTAQNGKNQCPPEKNSIVRLQEAVQSLQLARASFDQALPRVEQHQGADRDRLAVVIRNAKSETEWILRRWESLLREEKDRTSPPDDELQINLHRIESPWSTVMAELNFYLDHAGPWNINKFEVAMERTLPFYMLAKAGPNIKMRETAAQLMYLGTRLRGRSIAAPGSPPDSQRISEMKEEEEED